MKVKMINSVGEHVAGEEVDLDADTADRFILLGYAEGDPSREYTAEERQSLAASNQEVGV
jgi:hypothetical protein